MALSLQDQDAIKALLGRTPSKVELTIFDTMWSEHCSYKSSKALLKKYLPTQGSEVALGIGEDSGIIRFCEHEGKQYCIAISHESHNHPSQILPIEGAATGVGGVVRDVYCMGADVVGVLNSLHFGINEGHSPLVDDIAQNVVIGVSDYANPLGVPVLGGETLYHPSYNDNCLVNVAALGLVEENKIIRSKVPTEAHSEPYDIILFGKSTDATGFGGASFSSATLDKENEAANIGAVQVHDPFLKRVTVEAIKALLEVVHQQNIKIGFKDLGAGGISCATSEIAVAGGFGVVIDLDKVNVAFDHLNPEVIACSETQERFCLAVPRSFSQQVLDIFNKEYALPELYPHAGAVVIGEVVTEPVYRILYQGNVVCDLPIQAITTEVTALRHPHPRTIKKTVDQSPSLSETELKKACASILGSVNAVSKRYVYRYFDNAVRGDTIIYPGEADAVVISPVQGCQTGLTVSIDSNLYGNHDPYVSGAAAVAEAVRNVIAVGGKPIAVTDCLNYGNPENPSVFFDFEEGIKGIADAANTLGFIPGEALPVISGNVSFYNDSKQGNAVVPSPVIVVVGKVADYRKALTMQLTEPNQHLYLIGNRYAEFGGTQIQTFYPHLSSEVAPQVRLTDEAAQNKAIHDLIQASLVSACHDISSGGLWTTLCEMLLGERGLHQVGAAIFCNQDLLSFLFSENGGYVISVQSEHQNQVEALLKQHSVAFSSIGHTTQNPDISIQTSSGSLFQFPLPELEKIWNQKNTVS